MASGGVEVTRESLLEKLNGMIASMRATVNPKLSQFTGILRKYNLDLDLMLVPKTDRKGSIEETIAQLKSTNILLSMIETFFIGPTTQIATHITQLTSGERLSAEEKRILDSYHGGDYPESGAKNKLLGLALDVKKFDLALTEKLHEVDSIDIDGLHEKIMSHGDELPAAVQKFREAFSKENEFDVGSDFSADASFGSLDGSFDASFGSFDRPNVTATKLTGLQALSSSGLKGLMSSSFDEGFPDFPTPPSSSSRSPGRR